jgi:hypothetical protein
MNNAPNLLGKLCEVEPREYKLRNLLEIAKKLGLHVPRRSYELLCQTIRNYYVDNNINSESDLISHITRLPRISSVPLQRPDSSSELNLRILLNGDPDAFLGSVEHFQNIRNYQPNILKIGENSANGFIRKLAYSTGATNYDIVLKSCVEPNSDSLIYEFLVGQCVNLYSRFYPCFSKTYMVGKYKSRDIWQMFRDLTPPISGRLSDYIDIFDPRDIKKMIKSGCQNNQQICIFTQYIPIKGSIKSFLKKYSNDISTVDNEQFQVRPDRSHKLYKLATMLHMTHQLLSSFSNILTHYDLHLGNLALVKLPKGSFISVNYHYPNSSVVSYNTTYIPVLIDYGRCFVNCKAMNSAINSSEEIMRVVCQNDSRSKGAVCLENCGNATGYQFSTDYDDRTKSFVRARADNFYIDYTRRNMSHDLRLLNDIIDTFNFSAVSSGKEYIQQTLIADFFMKKMRPMDTDFGSIEHESSPTGRISNVNDAAQLLTEIVANPQFVAKNNEFLGRKTLYGTLDIWTDLSRNFVFS